MISISRLGKQFEKVVIDNAPTILTGVAVIGSFSTAYLTGKASFKAAEIMREEKQRLYREHPSKPATPEHVHLSPVPLVRLLAPSFIPAGAALTVTVASIVCAHRVNAKRAAALMAAYGLSERRLTEYRDKIVEKMTPAKEQKARDEIAQERVNAQPIQGAQIIMTGHGQVTCYDMVSDRYFKSDVEKIRRVENEINSLALTNGAAELGDFHVALGLNRVNFADEFGWTPDDALKIEFHGVLTEDDEPCVAMDYRFVSLRGSDHQSKCENPPF